jgi:hypothetical protein
MTLTIELPTDIEADLVAEARTHGLETPQYVEHLPANRFLRGRDLPFHRPSAPPHGVNQPAAFRTRRLLRMTQSAAKASTAIAEDDHPSRYEAFGSGSLQSLGITGASYHLPIAPRACARLLLWGARRACTAIEKTMRVAWL